MVNVNGQDDIVWYSAARVSSQVYRCRISVANHRGLGQFIVHAYAQMPDNSNIFLGAAGFTTAAPSVGQVQASAADRTRGRFTVRISGVKNGGLIRQLQVPVWSKGDQSDIVWYTASRDSKGDYIVNVDISRHGFNCGTYHVHTYLTDVSGAQQFAGAAACEMNLRYQSFSAGDISGTESTYRITLNGLEVPAEAECAIRRMGSCERAERPPMVQRPPVRRKVYLRHKDSRPRRIRQIYCPCLL